MGIGKRVFSFWMKTRHANENEFCLRGKSFLRNALASVLIIVLLLPLVALGPGPSWGFVNAGYQQGTNETVVSSSEFVQPTVRRERAIDWDLDGIQDSLENLIEQSSQAVLLPVVVTLFSPVSSRDVERFQILGGRVTHVYRYVSNGFAGVIPAVNVSRFASGEGEDLVIIEQDKPLQYHLDVSVPLTRVRPLVWQTYGFLGSSNQSIAILDTGIDDSHPDVGPYGNLNFSRKLVGWFDATSDNALAPQDFGEHGTHVAGIAAGTGAANSLQGSGNIQTTFTYRLPKVNSGYGDYLDIANPGTISLSVTWGGGNTVGLRLDNPAGTSVKQTSGNSQPLTLTYSTVGTSYPTGRYRVVVFNLGGSSGIPFSCVETYPYQGLNDGYNLFTGVAPNSKLVGVKVFNNGGYGAVSNLLAGMDWVIQNRKLYHISVASMSVGLPNGATDTSLNQKADALVQNGIVTTVSAGNDFPDYTIGSPGTAAYVITVAATNDQNGVAIYSSNGDVLKNEFGLIKPDVSAPGGSFEPAYGNQIMSADSNDVDAAYSGYADRNVNDYQQMSGTSMSAPYVAGLASLIIQALGGWNWTLDEALKVKMIIGMTAFETQSGEGTNVPSLDRGGKDSKEGFGRVSADAAIEAATMTYNLGELASDNLGSQPSAKKVWARQVGLTEGNNYRFLLSVPSGSDYDLYLYDGSPDNYGQPVILARSINASVGGQEEISCTATKSGHGYILVKWVSGNGAFTLQSQAAPVHDVSVVNVEPAAAKVYSGLPLSISVRVKNLGISSETFDVTAYYNSTSIETQTVTSLMPGTDTSLVFSWSTSGVLIGKYVVSAAAQVVSGDANVTNNFFSDGLVQVKIPGDLTGDNWVNVFDAIQLSTNFNRSASDYPDGDVNGDGVINVLDAIVLMSNWSG